MKYSDVSKQKIQMEQIIIQWRAYKEEYEKLSDWLQQIENSIKIHKTTLFSNVLEKENQLTEVQVYIDIFYVTYVYKNLTHNCDHCFVFYLILKNLVENLEKEQVHLEKINNTAAVLLQSHLDTYVNNQLRHLNSRYQVFVNSFKYI